MPDICLVIADSALRSSIAEQLAVAGFGEVRVEADLAAAFADEKAAAVILDQSSADKKNLKALKNASVAGRKQVFLLGDFEAGPNESLPVEIFAKPLRLGHLLARLQFHMQASPKLRASSFAFGPYRFEPQSRRIVMEGKDDVIRLTEKETALLEYLGNSPGPVGREELLAAIWGYDGRIDTHTLETHIYQLRRKLDPEKGGAYLQSTGDGAYCLRRK